MDKKEKLKLHIRVNSKEHIEGLRVNPFSLGKFRCSNTNNPLQGPAQGIVHVRNTCHLCSPLIRTFPWLPCAHVELPNKQVCNDGDKS